MKIELKDVEDESTVTLDVDDAGDIRLYVTQLESPGGEKLEAVIDVDALQLVAAVEALVKASP